MSESTVHSTVPEIEVKRSTYDHKEFRDMIYAYLNHGKEQAQTTDQIAKQLRLKLTRTNEKIRIACGELVMNDGKPVCSCSKGFFIATTDQEIQECVNNLEDRALSLHDRAKSLRLTKPIAHEPREYLYDDMDQYRKRDNFRE